MTATTVVDDPEVRQLYDAAMEKVRVQYLLLPAQKFQDSVAAPDSATIQKYYQDHPDEFRHGDRAMIRYGSFDKVASGEDSAAVQLEAADLSKRARSGEDFASLVRQFSEDVSTPDGDLGWFGKGAMVKPFEDAAFAMDSGQISDPVASRFGYHIIKVDGRRGIGDSIQVKAAHVLLKVEASSGTLSDLRQKAEQFGADAKTEDLDSLAAKLKMMPYHSGYFERGQSMGGALGNNPAVTEFAFSSKKGALSNIFETPSSFVVAQVTERDPAGITPLKEVFSRIRIKLQAEAAKQRAYEILAAIHGELEAGMSFAEGAKRVSGLTDSTTLFGRLDPVVLFGDDPVFHGAAFALKEQKISPVARVNRGAVVLELIAHVLPDPQTYTEKRDSIMTATLQAKQQMAFNSWYDQLKKAADIKDFRYQIPGEY